MTLFETETILEDLSKRHPNLNKELLTTILTASGWEERSVQEAVLLLGERQKKGGEGPATKEPVPQTTKGTVGEILGGVAQNNSVQTSEQKSDPHLDLGLVDGQLASVVPIVEVPTVAPPQEASSNLKKIQTFEQDGGLVINPTPTRLESLPIPNTREKQEAVEKVINSLAEQRPMKVKGREEAPPQTTPAEMTFYKQDGEEEGELPAPPLVTVVRPEKVSVSMPSLVVPAVAITPGDPKEERTISSTVSKDEDAKPREHVAPSVSRNEPESLIVHEEPKAPEVVARVPVPHQIPENLPLLPFESSPHVWSFSRYKNVFHSEPQQVAPPLVVPPIITPLFNDSATPVFPSNFPPAHPKSEFPQQSIERKAALGEDDEEISLEKVPLTKGDESLVFLAGVMLLVIILILGYMYSNGRL